MDNFIQILRQFPPPGQVAPEQYHQAAKSHAQLLDKLKTDAHLQSSADKLLQHVDPSFHSMSYLDLLSVAYLKRNPTCPMPDELIQCSANFLLQFDPIQIRYVGAQFSKVLETLQTDFPASIAVDLLTTALLRLDPAGSTLTSHHIALAELALRADVVQPALRLLDRDVIFFPGIKALPVTQSLPCDPTLHPSLYLTPESGLTARLRPSDLLSYDLVCGMCHLSRKSWQRAFECFERCATYPTMGQGCSKIMMDAYNKWLLVGLVLHGKAPTLPHTTGAFAKNAYQSVGKPYMAIAKAFEGNSAQKLVNEIADVMPSTLFSDDGNLGLVDVVRDYYQRWQVKRLRSIFDTISLSQIRECTQSGTTGEALNSDAQVELLVRGMLKEGMLRGEIVEPTTGGVPLYLRFLGEEDDDMGEEAVSTQMAEATRRIKALEPIIKATNERLATNPSYIRWLIRERQKMSDGPRAGTVGVTLGSQLGEDGMDISNDTEDEDLMTDIQ